MTRPERVYLSIPGKATRHADGWTNFSVPTGSGETRLTSIVLDIINSHVGGNKGSFAVFLFVLLLCQQLGLGLFSRDDVFDFCTRRKKKSVIVRKGSRHRSAKCMDLEDSNSTAVASDAVFERGGSAT